MLIIDDAAREQLSRSPRRAAFFCRAVAELAGSLAARGSRLIVRRGPLNAALNALVKETAASAVFWSAGYSARAVAAERESQSRLEERGVRAVMIHDAPAIAPEETATQKSSGGEGYRALVPYIETWRALDIATYEAPLLMRFAQSGAQSEALPDPCEFGSFESVPDATPTAASQILDRFLQLDALQYSSAVNVPAADRTSHLAAHLSFGTIAARTVVRETKLRIEDPFLLSEERASLRKYLAALAHRDFFLQLAWFHPYTEKVPLQEKMRRFPCAKTHPSFDAWCEGRTGYPIVDAGIRQMRATGWMHPRVRSIAASFLCFDLGVDWRAGMQEWDRHFIEDDEALATGNWQWIAGVGADLAAYPRIYNPLKQARRFDPEGSYVRTWIPELAHHLGAWRPAPQRSSLPLPLFGPNTYSDPVVDHERAAREFLARYKAFAATDGSEAFRRSSR
ncbi:MAG: deoxyribodipyrimidine photo-lyase [Vulcanimicrobiaceae bacterium]